MNEKVLANKVSLLYVFRNKETGEYVDENFDPTTNVFEAVGYAKMEDAIEALKEFDEPDEWYIVTKITQACIYGQPIEIKEFI